MIEKFSVDFIKKIYLLLTMGNEDVNFYSSCIQNRNREAVSNQPLQFALKVLKINFICRIPFLKNKFFVRELGKDHLTDFYIRLGVSNLAPGMLNNSQIITDVFGCTITTIKSKSQIYQLIEEETGIKGFSKMREKFDNNEIPINHIYDQINKKLNCILNSNLELAVFEKHFILNKYTSRLLDIANNNDVKVIALINKSYPREFVEKQLQRFGIVYDELYISSENNEVKSNILSGVSGFTAVLSSDYDFIKSWIKKGCKHIFYKDPKALMKQIKKPKVNQNFSDIYDGICGIRLLSGLKNANYVYELAYLCIAPAVFGFRQSKAKNLNDYLSFDPEAEALLEGIISEEMIPSKSNKKNLHDIYKAIQDFERDFIDYSNKTGDLVVINGKDASKLYKCAYNDVKNLCRI